MNYAQTIEQQLDVFEKSIGSNFFFVGDGKEFKQRIHDKVEGVDRELQMVTGIKGDYPVEFCRLKQEQPQALKGHMQQLTLL